MKTIVQASDAERVDLYRQRSQECLDLAEIAVEPSAKAAFLGLADNYARLADIESKRNA